MFAADTAKVFLTVDLGPPLQSDKRRYMIKTNCNFWLSIKKKIRSIILFHSISHLCVSCGPSGAPRWPLQEARRCFRTLPLFSGIQFHQWRVAVPPALNLWTKATNEKWGHLLSPEGLCRRRRRWMMKRAQLELHIVSLQLEKKEGWRGAAQANSCSSDYVASNSSLNQDSVFQIGTSLSFGGSSVRSSAQLLLSSFFYAHPLKKVETWEGCRSVGGI